MENLRLRRLPIAVFYHALYFPLRFLFLDHIALIKGLLALSQADQRLRPAAHEIDLERYEGKALLRHLPGKLADLFFMQQKFARPERFVVRYIALRIDAD